MKSRLEEKALKKGGPTAVEKGGKGRINRGLISKENMGNRKVKEKRFFKKWGEN